MHVVFKMHTPEVGRNAGKPVLYISLRKSPDTGDEVFRAAKPEDIERFPAEYLHFKPKQVELPIPVAAPAPVVVVAPAELPIAAPAPEAKEAKKDGKKK